jgi:hypothetical protein
MTGNKLPVGRTYYDSVLWIRIRIDLAVLNPDPYWECGSGFKSMEIDQNEQINLIFMPFIKAYCTFVGMFFDLLPILTYRNMG